MKTAPLLKTALLLGAVVFLASATPGAAAERTWTDASGTYTIQAELVDSTDGLVRLKLADGRIITVALSSLSTADRQYVATSSSAPAAAPSGTRPTISAPQDAAIEFLSGSKVQGRITAWDDKYVSFVTTLSGRSLTRKYPAEKILAVTIEGTRYVLNEGQSSGAAPRSARSGSRSTPTRPGTSSSANSRVAIERRIDELGRAQPDWWDSVQLNYPRSLDLSWPQKPPGNWNAQRNVGQYLWEVIHPNPNKWREGIRLVHHLLEMHANDPEKRGRAMRTLGGMYLKLQQDYARAAFWYRQAGVDRDLSTPAGIHLAQCYWKLGSKQMAMDLLKKNAVFYSTIKLLADMGETDEALRLAESGARGGSPDVAYIHAGDACRVAGQFPRALEYYQKVLQVRPSGKAAKRIQRNHTRARANIEGIRLFDALDLAKVPDGTYQASSPGYAGDVRIAVTVAAGQIRDVRVTQHQEKQFFSSINDTTRQIVERQTLKGIDATSSATMTSEAIINATAKALSGAMR